MTVRGHVFVLGYQCCLFAGIIHAVFIITLFLLFVFIHCVSSTNKTDRHEKTENLLKVALKHHKTNKPT
jgi:uncharacterized membrane protein